MGLGRDGSSMAAPPCCSVSHLCSPEGWKEMMSSTSLSRQGEETPHPLAGQKPQSAAMHQCPLAHCCAPVSGALAWDCLQMLVTSSHRLGIPSPAVTQLRALLPLPIFKTYIKKAFFFFIFFFFQGVFACQSERDVFDLCAWAPTPAKTAWPFQESMLRSSHAYNDTDIHTVTQGI